MSEYSKPIRLEIDTTMMEDTEIRIIESHIEAIRRVGSGAQPQGQPDPVPEWRQFVDASPAWIKQAHRDEPSPAPSCSLCRLPCARGCRCGSAPAGWSSSATPTAWRSRGRGT